MVFLLLLLLLCVCVCVCVCVCGTMEGERKSKGERGQWTGRWHTGGAGRWAATATYHLTAASIGPILAFIILLILHNSYLGVRLPSLGVCPLCQDALDFPLSVSVFFDRPPFSFE